MNLNVTQLQSEQDAEYAQFLDRLGETSPSVLAYHYPFYRRMLEGIGVGDAQYFAVRDGAELVGVLPGFLRRNELGSAFCSLPFFGPNAGALCDSGGRSAEFTESLLKGVVRQLREANPDLLSVSIYTPFLLNDYDSYDASLPEAMVVNKFTQCHNIQTPDWDSSVNRNVRKAERNGLVLSREITDERIREFYEIYTQNCADYGIPLKPFGAVAYLMNEARTSSRVRCYFGLQAGRLVAGLMVLASGQTVSYYIPCTAAEARTYHPGTFLIFHALQDARTDGFRFWNWESSPSRESGVYAYKKKWGAREYPYRIYVLPVASARTFRNIGRERLTTAFPFFFVYPFDRFIESAPVEEIVAS